MKKIISIILICSLVFSLIGCGSNKNINLNNKNYEFIQYGLFNMNEKNENIQYQVIIGNVIWSCILCETIFVPVILIGWFLYEPVSIKNNSLPNGVLESE